MDKQKGFWLKQPVLLQTNNKQLCSSDSPKDWFFECKATPHTKYENLDDTKEGNLENRSVRTQNVQCNSMRRAAKLKRFQGYQNNGTRGSIKKWIQGITVVDGI